MKKKYLSRKENIIITAIEIIDELGIQGLTIRELANRQEVTEAAIYRHFKNKEGIILAVIEKFSFFDSMIKNTIVEQSFNTYEGILFFVKSYGEYYENYPAITSVLFTFDTFKEYPEISEYINKIITTKLEFIVDFINKGIENGEVRDDVKNEEMADIISGLISEVTRRWRLNNYEFSLKDKLISAVEMLLMLCLTKKS